MNVFHSLAGDYARYRPGLPEKVARLLARALDGVPEPTLLDLGSGTGQVPLALLPFLPPIAHLHLVDQDKGMLRQAFDALEPRLGQRTAALHPVAAEHFEPLHHGYRTDLITCARAFHWMNRPAVLSMADRVSAPGASVAVMGDGSLWTHEAAWTDALKGLIQSYLGPQRHAGVSGLYAEPGRRFEDDLADSAFSDIATHRFPVSRMWAPEEVVGYLRSTSFAHPDLFAGRHAEFEADARRLLNEHARGGTLREQTVFSVLLARRPREAR